MGRAFNSVPVRGCNEQGQHLPAQLRLHLYLNLSLYACFGFLGRAVSLDTGCRPALPLPAPSADGPGVLPNVPLARVCLPQT